VNTVINLQVPQNVGNFLTSWKPISFSRRTLLHGVNKQARYDRKTTLTWRQKMQRKNTHVHTAQCCLADRFTKGTAHDSYCITSGFHIAFKFRGLLGSTLYSYLLVNCIKF
jgi:hypothetical protein